MSNIKQTVRKSLLLKTSLFVITLLVFGALTGCAEYKKYETPHMGIFYPNGCVTLNGEKPNRFLDVYKTENWEICQPVRFWEMGTMTYSGQYGIGGTHEVARLELGRNTSLCVWISTLTYPTVGRIEYTNDSQPLGEKFLRNVSDAIMGGINYVSKPALGTYFAFCVFVAVCVMVVTALIKGFFS